MYCQALLYGPDIQPIDGIENVGEWNFPTIVTFLSKSFEFALVERCNATNTVPLIDTVLQ